MATIYYDYAVGYNSETIVNSQNNGLTSIPISYNGSVLANTTSSKTLACSGKRCASDIVIGSTTLECEDKVMKSDVTVTITPRYKWQKYTIGSQYVAYTSSSSATLRGLYSYSSTARLYTGSGYTINQSLARFDLASIATETSNRIQHFNYLINNTGLWTCGSSSSGSSNMSVSTSGSSSAGGWAYGLYGNAVCHANSGSSQTGSSSQDTGYLYWVTVLMLTTQQIRGTYVEDVTSTSSSAYPTNGVSGSYWYVAI